MLDDVKAEPQRLNFASVLLLRISVKNDNRLQCNEVCGNFGGDTVDIRSHEILVFLPTCLC